MELQTICKNVESGNGFVGIMYEKNIPTIYFPLSYYIPKDDHECQKSILSLFKALYISERYQTNSTDVSVNNGTIFSMPIYSYLWLINDYINNGILSSKDTIYGINATGKINWKRTMRNNRHYIDDQVFFVDTVNQKKVDKNELITRIHIKCLEIAINTIGFVFGNLSLPKDDIAYSNEFLISVLRTEQYRTYIDRRKQMIREMILILQSEMANDYTRKIKSFGTFKFELVWEKIIERLFGNEKELSKFYPQTWYEFQEDTSLQRILNSKLRPDTIINFDEKCYIVDAKYYPFNDKLLLPSSSDIQKQITYADFVKEILIDKNEIYNAFIIPYNSHCNNFGRNSNIEFIGYGMADWRKTSMKLHDRISLILLDMKFALDSYAKFDYQVEINNLIQEIEKSKITIK